MTGDTPQTEAALPRILMAPHHTLLHSAAVVATMTPAVLEVVGQLEQLLLARRALSLSAPQIGQSMRLFVLAERLVGPGAPRVFVNPVMTFAGPSRRREEELCFSVPNAVRVNRATVVRVQARGLDGALFEVEAADSRLVPGKGVVARAAQHEIDHLNGILITRRRA